MATIATLPLYGFIPRFGHGQASTKYVITTTHPIRDAIIPSGGTLKDNAAALTDIVQSQTGPDFEKNVQAYMGQLTTQLNEQLTREPRYYVHHSLENKEVLVALSQFKAAELTESAVPFAQPKQLTEKLITYLDQQAQRFAESAHSHVDILKPHTRLVRRLLFDALVLKTTLEPDHIDTDAERMFDMYQEWNPHR